MKKMPRLYSLFSLGAALLFAPVYSFAKDAPPNVSHDGLVRVQKSKNADSVYLLPGVDLSGFDKVFLMDPTISFYKNWKSEINDSRNPMDRISDSDMQKMIAEGEKMCREEFTKVLTKNGYPVVDKLEPGTLIVRPIILNLYIVAPDPDNTANMWSRTYADGAGSATLCVELYDGVTKQILARALDTKDSSGTAGNWSVRRTQATNKADARYAFQDWAASLAKGLDRAKEEAAAAKSGG